MSLRSKTGLLFVSLGVLGAVGCGPGDSGDAGPADGGGDTGAVDSGRQDGGNTDGGRTDGGRDTGPLVDTGPMVMGDTGTDSGTEDTGVVIDIDTGVIAADSGPDTGVTAVDSGTDSGPPVDVGPVDAAAAPVDAGPPDSSIMFMTSAEVEPNDDGMTSTGGSGREGNDFSSNVPPTQAVLSMNDQQITAALGPAGDEDVFALSNTTSSPRSVSIYTSTPGNALGCSVSTGGIDTVISIRNAMGTLLAQDDDSGVNACSLVHYRIPANTTVYVHVTDFGDADTIAAYAVGLSECGNGVVGPGETCDDGNLLNTDSCNAFCTGAPRCGDGLVAGTEQCDDGNTSTSDGCSMCVIQPNFDCRAGTEPSQCSGICGDSVRVSGEQCDDGNQAPNDGCSRTCQVEPGAACTQPATGPAMCTLLCAAPTPLMIGATNVVSTLGAETIIANVAQPSGTGCTNVFISEDGGRYYSLRVPAGARVEVSATSSSSTADMALLAQPTCGATTCSASAASTFSNATASLFLENTTTADVDYAILALSDEVANFSISSARRPATCSGLGNLVVGAVDATATLTGEDVIGGIVQPTGSGCTSVFVTERGGRNYNLRVPAGARVEVSATSSSSTSDMVLLAQSTCGGTTCSGSGTTTTSVRTASMFLENPTAADVDYTVLVLSEELVPFDLRTTRRAPTCAGLPSLVVGAENVTSTLTGQTYIAGIAQPTGAGCGNAFVTEQGGRNYALTVPPMSSVDVVATPALSNDFIGLFAMDACAGSTCSGGSNDAAADGDPVTLSITNAAATPVTYNILVLGEVASGTFSIATTRRALTFMPIRVECEDMTTATALTFLAASGEFGTPLDDGNTDPAALPFPVPFYGTMMTHYSVVTNGLMMVYPAAAARETGSGLFTNASIPTAATPNGLIAPFWDDLYMNGSGAPYGASVRTIGAAPNRTFVVEWRAHFSGTAPEVLRFQAKFYEGITGVEFHYCSMPTDARSQGNEATVGTENATGTAGRQASFNSGSLVRNATAILVPTN